MALTFLLFLSYYMSHVDLKAYCALHLYIKNRIIFQMWIDGEEFVFLNLSLCINMYLPQSKLIFLYKIKLYCVNFPYFALSRTFHKACVACFSFYETKSLWWRRRMFARVTLNVLENMLPNTKIICDIPVTTGYNPDL
jgi:hypothetical protein